MISRSAVAHCAARPSARRGGPAMALSEARGQKHRLTRIESDKLTTNLKQEPLCIVLTNFSRYSHCLPEGGPRLRQKATSVLVEFGAQMSKEGGECPMEKSHQGTLACSSALTARLASSNKNTVVLRALQFSLHSNAEDHVLEVRWNHRF